MKYEAPGNLRRALLGLTIVIYERPVPNQGGLPYEEEALPMLLLGGASRANRCKGSFTICVNAQPDCLPAGHPPQVSGARLALGARVG